ncbi:MAG: hypothetical protein KJZ93_22780 [Caldilineaceae bacterium]|nr:hypothetical protein [Caldilineaceae bacterium]
MTANEAIRFSSTLLARWIVDLNTMIASMIAGATSGVAAGGLARIAMRVVAILAGERPAFSVGGTVGILVIFAILGIIAAFPYLIVRRWLPGPSVGKGMVYGMMLAALICIPFFRAGEGELGIVSPVTGATLFAPIGLFYSMALSPILRRVERRFTQAQPVAGWWFGLFSLALLFALVRMFGAFQGYIRTPGAVQRLYLALGIEYGAIQEVQGFIALLFALTYCTLCALLFVHGWRSRFAQRAAVALLLLGGVLLPLNSWAGASTMETGLRVEWLVWALATLLLLGVAGVSRWWLARWSDAVARQATAWLASSVGLSLVAFLVMWAAVLLSPGLQLRRLSGFYTLFVVPLYLWPWLLCPLALLVNRRWSQQR